VKAISPSITLLLAAGMTLSSAIVLVYSLLSRLLLLRVMSFSHAHIDIHDKDNVDEMMMEYMTALMQQASDRQDERLRSRSMSQSSLKRSGGDGFPRLIVPLVIDEIFETANRTGGGRTPTAADSMLLRPIGDNQISTATLRTHDQIIRFDLDLQGKEGITRSGLTDEATVSGVVGAILGHCAVDETRGGTRVFSVQHDRWGQCDAAAEHLAAKLRSIGSSRPAQSQSKRGRSANTKVRRILGTSSSLEAGKGSSLRDEPLPSLLAPLLHQHLEQSDSTNEETNKFHGAGAGNSFTTDSTVVGASNTSSVRRPAGAGVGAGTGGARHQGQPSSCREFRSGTSKTDNSMTSRGARSVYHSTETTSVSDFRTSTAGSTASLNGGKDRDGQSITDSTSMRSFVTAEEME
jgi:hypothetical protein